MSEIPDVFQAKERGDEKKGGEKICIEMSIGQKPMRDDEKKEYKEKEGK